MRVLGSTRPRLRVHLSTVLVAVFGGAALAVAAPAGPAWAHGVGGKAPTSYKSVLTGIEPRVPGLSVRLLDLGDTVELRNTGGIEITVLGYDGEPYLRVGPDGVYRNERSPATFWNRSVKPAVELPPGFDDKAKPDWSHLSARRVVRWHDHDVHWMGTGKPSHPGREQLVDRWTIRLRRGDEPVVVHGKILWVPAPPAVWPLLVASALGLAVVLAGRTRRWHTALVASVAVLAAGEALHLAGQWGASSAGIAARVLAGVYSLLGLAFAAFALTGLTRRGSDPYDSVPAALVAALVLTIAGGLAGLPALAASQIPTTLPDPVARHLVGLALGVGGGTIALSGARLRRPG